MRRLQYSSYCNVLRSSIPWIPAENYSLSVCLESYSTPKSPVSSQHYSTISLPWQHYMEAGMTRCIRRCHSDFMQLSGRCSSTSIYSSCRIDEQNQILASLPIATHFPRKITDNQIHRNYICPFFSHHVDLSNLLSSNNSLSAFQNFGPPHLKLNMKEIPSQALLMRHHATRYNSSSSFIKSVMDQVKKDIENNPNLKRTVEELRISAEQNSNSSRRIKDKIISNFNYIKENCLILISTTSDIFQSAYLRASNTLSTVPAANYIANLVTKMCSFAVSKLKFVFNSVTKVAEHLKEENLSEKRAALWRQQQSIKRYQETQATENNSSGKQSSSVATKVADDSGTDSGYSEETALILSSPTAWGRFGTHLKDMPFLLRFFESPLMTNLFGETEIAASIRHMKIIDSTFKFPEFVDTVEHVVAPHIVECFLHGDKEALSLHCGPAAFSAAESSIKERELMKVKLDPTILYMRGVELRGAKIMEEGTPWFIFTFAAQQINCLRDENGKVISGAIDDIREVVYSMALTKHPEPSTVGLQYPWMVKELAIIGNNACW